MTSILDGKELYVQQLYCKIDGLDCNLPSQKYDHKANASLRSHEEQNKVIRQEIYGCKSTFNNIDESIH